MDNILKITTVESAFIHLMCKISSRDGCALSTCVCIPMVKILSRFEEEGDWSVTGDEILSEVALVRPDSEESRLARPGCEIVDLLRRAVASHFKAGDLVPVEFLMLLFICAIGLEGLEVAPIYGTRQKVLVSTDAFEAAHQVRFRVPLAIGS